MKTSKLLEKTILKLADLSFKDGRMLESQIVKSIKVLKSLPKIDAISALSEYLRFIKRIEREHTMYIETVVPLTFTQIKKAKRIVEGKGLPTGRQVKITMVKTIINPDILGGFKLRVGDQIWDESIKGKIAQIKEAIVS